MDISFIIAFASTYKVSSSASEKNPVSSIFALVIFNNRSMFDKESLIR